MQTQSQQSPIANLPAPWSKRVAIVLEDNEFQRRAMVHQLVALGIGRVDEAADAESALRLVAASESGYDVALCDLHLEGPGGLDFINRAKRGGVRGFVLTSAFQMQDILLARRKALSFGIQVSAVLAKPIQSADLAQILGESLGWGRWAITTPESQRVAA